MAQDRTLCCGSASRERNVFEPQRYSAVGAALEARCCCRAYRIFLSRSSSPAHKNGQIVHPNPIRGYLTLPSLLYPPYMNPTDGQVSASIDEQQDMPSWVKEYASGLGKGRLTSQLHSPIGEDCNYANGGGFWGQLPCSRFLFPMTMSRFLVVQYVFGSQCDMMDCRGLSPTACLPASLNEMSSRGFIVFSVTAADGKGNIMPRSYAISNLLKAQVLRHVLLYPPCCLEEIYVVSIGAFAGRGFSELVRELFEQHGVILLGISEDRRVVLHPGAGYCITPVSPSRKIVPMYGTSFCRRKSCIGFSSALQQQPQSINLYTTSGTLTGFLVY